MGAVTLGFWSTVWIHSFWLPAAPSPLKTRTHFDTKEKYRESDKSKCLLSEVTTLHGDPYSMLPFESAARGSCQGAASAAQCFYTCRGRR